MLCEFVCFRVGDPREVGRVKRREVIGCSGDKWKEEGVEIGGWEVIFIVVLVFEARCWLLLRRSDFVRGDGSVRNAEGIA